MIWAICILVTILCIAISIRVYFGKRTGLFRTVFSLGCLFIATYIMYIPPFYFTYGVLLGAVGNLVHVLRIITVDADITQFYQMILDALGNGVFSRIYISLLGLLHIALPAMSALSAVTVLLRCFSSIQLRLANFRSRPLFVFSEANERAIHLAKSLKKIKCDIVFAGSSADSLDSKNSNRTRFIFKEEAISELRIRSKRGKDIYYFCISENEDLSLSCALNLIEKCALEKDEVQEHIHIYQFSRNRDFSVFIDSADKGMLDVQCINECEIIVYNLLDRYPLMQSARDGIHVLLYGCSRLNMIALKAILWCGQLSGISLRISLVGVRITEQVNALQLEVPGIFAGRYNVQFYDCLDKKEVAEKICQTCADANYIIVSETTDNETMEQGIFLRRLFYKLDPEFSRCPPIFCHINEPSKFHLIKQLSTAESNPKRKMNYDLIPFGSLEDVFTYEKLVNSDLEKLAKNVHLAYEEIFAESEIDTKEALKRYSTFEVNKRSNRANALHIRYKLNLIGLDYTDEQGVEDIKLQDCCTEEMLEQMSISEHSRWMAFLESEGWISATKENVQAYRNSGISKGRHNCPILKMHPYICEYEDLKDLSLELEGKDTTVYDKELIVRIPEILGDKWNISGKKYRIVKIDQK